MAEAVTEVVQRIGEKLMSGDFESVELRTVSTALATGAAVLTAVSTATLLLYPPKKLAKGHAKQEREALQNEIMLLKSRLIDAEAQLLNQKDVAALRKENAQLQEQNASLVNETIALQARLQNANQDCDKSFQSCGTPSQSSPSASQDRSECSPDSTLPSNLNKVTGKPQVIGQVIGTVAETADIDVDDCQSNISEAPSVTSVASVSGNKAKFDKMKRERNALRSELKVMREEMAKLRAGSSV